MQNSDRELKPLKIAISGSSGFIGSALTRALRERGHEVRPILRTRSSDSNAIYWNPYLDIIEPAGLENLDVVINLAGKTIKAKRWSENDKAEFKDSRLKSTKLLAHAISRLKKAPKYFLSASAVGIYGDKGNELINESTAPGPAFLAQLCREWEMATWEAEAVGITVNHLRFGVVLSPQGGLLKALLPYFKLMLSATMGTGDQFLPWITLEDAAKAVVFLTENGQPAGPINIVAPTPINNRDFTKALAKAVHRPTFLKFSPKFVRKLFGEVGSSILLDSARVVPERLTKAGFQFAHPDFASALKSFF